MKKVIVFAISFAIASASLAVNPQVESSATKAESMSTGSMHSKSTSPASNDSADRTFGITHAGGSSVTVNGSRVSSGMSSSLATSNAVMSRTSQKSSSRMGSDSVSVSRGTQVSYGSQLDADASQQGATKTRCITQKSGNVEEKVCAYTTISMEEAAHYFDAASRTKNSTHR